MTKKREDWTSVLTLQEIELVNLFRKLSQTARDAAVNVLRRNTGNDPASPSKGGAS